MSNQRKMAIFLILNCEQKKYAGTQNIKDLLKFMYLFLVAAMDD
jgi:hypothetical protein